FRYPDREGGGAAQSRKPDDVSFRADPRRPRQVATARRLLWRRRRLARGARSSNQAISERHKNPDDVSCKSANRDRRTANRDISIRCSLLTSVRPLFSW